VPVRDDEGVGVGEYVNAGGVRTYYEVYGGGEPLVLLRDVAQRGLELQCSCG